MRKSSLSLLILLIISISINIFIVSKYIIKRDSTKITNLDSETEKYPYLSKRILADIPNDYLINFVILRSKLRSFVSEYGDEFAIFFEYLPTGVSVGVNDREEFTAASLLKVPVVMANLLQEETEGKDSMPKTITLTQDMLNNTFGTLYMRGEGATIKREEAIKYALEESDNTAIQALISITDLKYYNQVNEGLDIELTKDINEFPVTTVKAYSSILKSLYYSSIVNKEHSQLILNHLSNSKFDDKLVAGVSPGVKVANKIGVVDNSLYSDCGIVYIPRRPYLLCLVSNADEQKSEERMVRVSKYIFDYISNVNK